MYVVKSSSLLILFIIIVAVTNLWFQNPGSYLSNNRPQTTKNGASEVVVPETNWVVMKARMGPNKNHDDDDDNGNNNNEKATAAATTNTTKSRDTLGKQAVPPLVVCEKKIDSDIGKISFFDHHFKEDCNDETLLGQQQGEQQQLAQNNNSNCRLLYDTLVFLGCGREGRSFSVTMDCPHKNGTTSTAGVNYSANNDDGNSNSSSSDGSRRHHRKVVFKTSTRSTTESMIPTLIHIYQTLFDNDASAATVQEVVAVMTRSARDHFHAPMAMAWAPVNVLYEKVKKSKNPSHKRCRFDITTTTTKNGINVLSAATAPYELGFIAESAKGDRIRPRIVRGWNATHRRRTAQDLVWMYRHMYDRSFIHQDVSTNHIYDDGHVTSIIDFTTFQILNIHRQPVAFHSQLYQLMTLLANICNMQQLESYSYFVPSKVQIAFNSTNISELLSSIEECGFEKKKEEQQQYHYHHQEQQQIIPSTPQHFKFNSTWPLLLQAFQSNKTAQAYEILCQLTGCR